MKAVSTKFSNHHFDNMKLMLSELEYGLDTKTNTIYLNSDISTDAMYEVIARINFLIKCNSLKPSATLTVNVSSFGGDIYSMFGIHDFIRTLPIKVDTVCIGPAMSAAAFLLASGTGVRKMTRNSTVMFHHFTSSMEGKTADLVKNMGHIKKKQGDMNALLAEYTKKPKSFWEAELKEDLYLTADECLSLGVIDKIL